MYSSINCDTSFLTTGAFVGSQGCSAGGNVNGFYSCEASSNTAGSSISAMLSSYASHINNNGYYNGFAWTYDSEINKGSVGENMVGIACREVLIDKERAVMIGVSGLTSVFSATTHLENQHTYGQTTTRVQPVVSGITFTIDADGGGKSQVYITGVSTIDIVNVKDGSSFVIKTETDGAHTIAWTASGYTFLFAGGTSDPGNNKIDLFRFEVFGSIIYGQRISDFS
jgi:hypothetical protein